jgi:hypothetical protein
MEDRENNKYVLENYRKDRENNREVTGNYRKDRENNSEVTENYRYDRENSREVTENCMEVSENNREVIENYREDRENNSGVIENYREGTINREVIQNYREIMEFAFSCWQYLQGCDAVYICRYVLSFQRNVMLPRSEQKLALAVIFRGYLSAGSCCIMMEGNASERETDLCHSHTDLCPSE